MGSKTEGKTPFKYTGSNMVKMDSPAACAGCAMLIAGKSSHSVAGMQFFVDLKTLGYLEKSWSVRASDGEIQQQL